MMAIFHLYIMMFQGKISTQIFYQEKHQDFTGKHWDYVYREVGSEINKYKKGVKEMDIAQVLWYLVCHKYKN